jgi:bifunctional non-homologous end joining protein LigD
VSSKSHWLETMATHDYSRKRNFEKTPEPRPGGGTRRPADSFVVHRHEARRLHYDFRVAVEDRLLSWAVPKGFSYNPTVKRLAVRTEDHPLEYLEFRGIIPRGEYGAGTIDIWDQGTFRLIRGASVEEAAAAGEIKLRLYGRRLRGEWHLVRTRNQDWLLFKARDLYAREGDTLLPSSMDPGRLEPEELPLDLEPMTPAGDSPPFSDPGWLYELDFEGWRVYAGKQEGEPFLRFSGHSDHRGLPESLSGQIGSLGCETALLDAVLVGLDDSGRPSRAALSAAWAKNPGAVTLYLVDILNWEGFSTRKLSLLDRKHLLRSILPPSVTLMYVDAVAEQGERLAAEAARAGMGALLAKRADSPYVPGPSKAWRRMLLSGGDEPGGVPGPAPALAAPRGLRLTNPGKVFWPVEGYTKRDLYEYYEAVAELVVPHLRGRPVHLRRFPNGIEGKSFYQRKAPEHTPDWVTQVELGDPPERYILCDDRRTLLYLVNLGSIDLHPWLSRAASADSPDWAVVDIDAKESSFQTAVKVARKTGGLLRGLGIQSFLKTSGGTGLHVFVPLAPGYSYEQSRFFAEAVARVVAVENRDAATIERKPRERRGKVYVDFLQNRRGQTIVPPYSARPVPGAKVSMPLDWDELRADLRPERFTIRTALERVRERGDLFRSVLDGGEDLLAAGQALQRYVEGGRGRAAQ